MTLNRVLTGAAFALIMAGVLLGEVTLLPPGITAEPSVDRLAVLAPPALDPSALRPLLKVKVDPAEQGRRMPTGI